jgi:molecular chaperone DnaK
MAIIGIDLGTSNSAAAISLGGEVRMIEPAEGSTDEGMVFPSYIAFDAMGKYSCAGIAAKRQFHSAADLVVRHAKRLIGRSFDYLSREVEAAESRGRGSRFLDEFKDRIERGQTGEVLIKVGKTAQERYTPQEIARIILEKVRQDAEPQVRQLLGSNIDGAVITVPAGFDDASLRATLWAGEQVFGSGRVQLIAEPLAAAIASGVQKSQETIMVVDMGAGTTDIVVGNVIRTAGSFQWVPVTQSCDDELGGWDMDCSILEYLLHTDQREPYLRDVYPLLDLRAQGRLMEAIERAKIAVSTSDNGHVSLVLEAQDADGRAIRKPVMFSLDSKVIKSIVAYKAKRSVDDKGSVVERCRKLVEHTLLELAGNNLERVAEVKRSMDRVILVGGPMRMRVLYDMMVETFSECPEVLEAFDPLNPFPMECVARGAALYQGGKILLQVPHTLSIFDWGKGGYQTLLARGTPYEGEAVASAKLQVEEGATWIDIITEKENVSLPNFPVREHIVRIPMPGELEITLRWDMSGCRVVLSGAGISQTEIPSISDQTTLGEDFKRQFRSFLQSARNLRSLLADPYFRDQVRGRLIDNVKQHAPPDLQMLFTLDPEAALEAWKTGGKTLRQVIDQEVVRLLNVPEEELNKCDALDPEALSEMQEDEIRLVLDRGYAEGAKDRARARGISERVYEAVRLVRDVLRDRVSVNELLNMTRSLLTSAEGASVTSSLIKDLTNLSDELQRSPSNRIVIANVSVRMAALADVLHDQGLIPRETLRRAKWVAAQAEL